MGTAPQHPTDLSSTLFGKTRTAVLGLLFGHADEELYLRQVARLAGVGLGAVQRELRALTEAGIVERVVRGRQVYFRANAACPVFAELKGIVTKTVGAAEVLRAALAPLSDSVAVALVFGSVARGEGRRDSDVDILVVGEVAFGDVVAALTPVQKTLGREVNPVVYPEDEFRRKVKARHHFLSSVLSGPRVFVVGDERELARLAE